MASGGRDPGAGRQARQAQIPGNFLGNQNTMRGIQQGMKQLQVSSGVPQELQQVDRQQMATPWTVTNLTQDKRTTRHAETLREIRHSLKNYELAGDVDSSLLTRCVELGFDEVGIVNPFQLMWVLNENARFTTEYSLTQIKVSQIR